MHDDTGNNNPPIVKDGLLTTTAFLLFELPGSGFG